MTPIIFKNISKSFNGTPVLVNINAVLSVGITCLMGQSGIGKTTFANLVAGLILPDEGTIAGLEGKRVSYVFQEDRLLEHESALVNVLFVTADAKKNTPRAIALLTQAGLGESVNKKAAELSGGMKRRTALCRALIADYHVLILDEPFKGLDEETKPAIVEMLKQHVQQEEKIILCITHDLAEVEALGGVLLRM
ncbi:MAG: ATP-binding cassette domain-containing protein [Defluviitaleaceae bacterium]|nr:ATP-binding cassette domain-containing protein [Defluviitaleaceae bacterium]MCL2274552.1 ATP-binding cassette domain-containing protein [Defluviitaleaceae bacterium]